MTSLRPSPILRMDAIEKHYAGITALGGVTFDLRAGEVHCLCGENGAGESTLIKIMAGSVRHDGGTITLDGETVQLASPQDGLRRGIGVVYQELELIPNLSIMENLVLGREPRTAFGTVAWTQVRREAEAVLAMMRVNLRVDRLVSTLTIAQAQLVAIAKILALKPRILVLDEPAARCPAANLTPVHAQLTASRRKASPSSTSRIEWVRFSAWAIKSLSCATARP